MCSSDLGDRVLEIGPGLGALTEGLLRVAGRVVAVEIDPRLVEALREVVGGHPRLVLVHGDALAVDLAALRATYGLNKVVANLPYAVTSPLLMRLLELDGGWELLLLMVQREVAERLAAEPGTPAYGGLTAAVRFYAEVEPVGVVSRHVFYPRPEVDSALVRLRPRPFPVLLPDPRAYFRVVRAAFGQRRKTLRNALRAAGWTEAQVDEALAATGIDGGVRGETLPPEALARLAQALPAGPSRSGGIMERDDGP